MFGRSAGAGADADAGERTLEENEVARLPGRGAPTVVRVERGTVLVTRQGDLEDHVLEGGDELLLPGGGLAVAWAFTPARIAWRTLPAGGARLAGLAARGLGAVRLEPVRPGRAAAAEPGGAPGRGR